MNKATNPLHENHLDKVIKTSKKAFSYIFLFSFASNILMLAMPIYSMQVLDRVVSSGSMETLFYITLITFLLFAAYGVFSFVRSSALIYIGEWFDNATSSQLMASTVATAAAIPGAGGSQSLRDLQTLKQFLAGPGLSALFDLPWSIIYLLVVFMVHPIPGSIALAGCVILLLLGILNERAVRGVLGEANDLSVKSMGYVDACSRNAEVVEAMGMTNAILARWQKINQKVQKLQCTASDRSNVIASVTKTLRFTLQMIIVAVGIWLVLHNQMSVGATIACSTLLGRVVAPFEGAIAAWSSVTSARKAYHRLYKFMDSSPVRRHSMDLPTPKGKLSVEKVFYGLPNGKPILRGIHFELEPGQILGIIGPSASGKSTLAKLLTGVWQATSGHVRLDNADVYTWNREDFGRHIGYMPQAVELLTGTVRDNIARLREDVKDEDVVQAAQLSSTHDFILYLPNGYETEVGPNGSALSAGQRQRVGLARAFFGQPKFMVLDEPNANLDDAGEAALITAIRNAKSQGITTVVITHRPGILNVVDKLLVLKDGAMADFGNVQEVIAKYSRPAAPLVGGNPPQGQLPSAGNPGEPSSKTAA